MNKKRIKAPQGKKIKNRKNEFASGGSLLHLYSELNHLKKHFEKLKEHDEKMQDRLEDAEIHINLLTRLLTVICVEKMGMRIGVLKRLLKRIEKEAIRDSQILHLESLYNLPHQPEKKPSVSPHPPKKDPWEDIS